MTIWIDDSTKLRVNIHAPYKGYSKLETAAQRAVANVVETPAPTPSQDVQDNPEHYIRTESAAAPYITWERRSDEQIAQMKRAEMDNLVISPWQLRKVLNHLALRDAVEAAVASANLVTRDGWEFAVEFRRNDPLVAAIGSLLGKSESEIDEIFIKALTL